MIGRNMYLAYADDSFKCEYKNIARYKSYVFYYLENDEKPEKYINEGLLSFPDGRLWIPMIDIFHYSKPLSAEHWNRKINNKVPEFRIAFLKPECVSAYIFYHYQLQEEKPGLCDKYGMIFQYGNMLVMYLENPREIETEVYSGALSTNNTPENMSRIVDEYFIRWENGEGWKNINMHCEESL